MNMRRQRQTKIVATLGPASDSPEKIRALFNAGVDLFRLNFSHGDHEKHRTVAASIRAIEQETGRPIGIMADLQGPKLRIGEFEQGRIDLQKGQTIRFDLNPALGNERRVNLPHPEIIKALRIDDSLFLDDGKVRARVTHKGDEYIDVEIETGHALSNRKGVNVPDVVLPLDALTLKDREDLIVALDMGVDWIAQSFVQRPEDVAEAQKLIQGRAFLMAKIEKPSALIHLDEIITLADGIMLARGDLGVEIPPEDVPAVQKRVVRCVREQGKPIIVATQMLESMISSARPTRAEASDVATAIYDGADAVMLSAETAAGEYPVRSVEMMDRIAQRTESDETYEHMMAASHPDEVTDPSDAITTAAYYVAQDIEAVTIVTYTVSGSTARRMARQRPEIPILCLTPNLDTARRLSVSYGVHAVHTPETMEDFTGPARHAAKIAQEQGMAKSGDKFIMTAGIPFGIEGSTNTLRIAAID